MIPQTDLDQEALKMRKIEENLDLSNPKGDEVEMQETNEKEGS